MAPLVLVPRTPKERFLASQLLRSISGVEYIPNPAGGTPLFKVSLCPGDYLGKLMTLFKEDGSFNGKSPIAEQTALCLVHRGMTGQAMELFKAIVGNDGRNVLFINRARKNVLLDSVEVANKAGKLGYEGAYQLGRLAAELGEEILAKKMFLEIAEKIPTDCFPVRLQDIRIKALEELKRSGISRVYGMPIENEIFEAKRHSRHSKDVPYISAIKGPRC